MPDAVMTGLLHLSKGKSRRGQRGLFSSLLSRIGEYAMKW